MPTGCPQRPLSQPQAAPCLRPATAHSGNHAPAGAARTRAAQQQAAPHRVLRPATAHPANAALAGVDRTKPISFHVKSAVPVPPSQEQYSSTPKPAADEHALLSRKTGSESALSRTEVVSRGSRDLLSAATTNTRGPSSIACAGEEAPQLPGRRARVATATARSTLPEGHIREAVKEHQQALRPYTAHNPPKARFVGEEGRNSPRSKRATPCLATFELREFLESAASGTGPIPHAPMVTDHRPHQRRLAETGLEVAPEQKNGAAESPTRTIDETSVRPTTAPALKTGGTWDARKNARGPLLKFREVRTVEDTLRRDRYYARQVASCRVWCS